MFIFQKHYAKLTWILHDDLQRFLGSTLSILQDRRASLGAANDALTTSATMELLGNRRMEGPASLKISE